MFNTYMTSEFDSHDDVIQRQGTFLNPLDFIIRQFLVEDSIDSILANDHRQAQKHLLIYTMIALHQQSYCSFNFVCPV